jgi:hypothetical protein
MEILKRFAEEKKARGLVTATDSKRPMSPTIQNYNISNIYELSFTRSPLRKSQKSTFSTDRHLTSESPQRKSSSILPDKLSSSQLKVKYYNSPSSKLSYITRPTIKINSYEPTVKNRDLGPGTYSGTSTLMTEYTMHAFSRSPRFSSELYRSFDSSLQSGVKKNQDLKSTEHNPLLKNMDMTFHSPLNKNLQRSKSSVRRETRIKVAQKAKVYIADHKREYLSQKIVDKFRRFEYRSKIGVWNI